MQILFLFPLTISSVALFHPSPQPARECVAEAVQAAILIVAILVTLNPHRGALTLLSILTIFLVNIVLEPRAADVVARLIGAVDHRDDERGAEATPGTPPLHPAPPPPPPHRRKRGGIPWLSLRAGRRSWRRRRRRIRRKMEEWMR